VTRSWLHERFVDDDRWKPFAWSAGITLLVVGVHTGAIDAVLLLVMSAQGLGG
jgi:hypothetical protein